ncbi:phosphonate ABC transporter ATP-binding protein [Oenococcus sicerae]|uniref:Phosphonate ABC transporter ATP-binding protein n=1 Tax=Oenococcus sicerae TaxID=2203724 RepID=A0AAJ1R9S2_9LACO|nr:phosphonate ABC transporter ATP-binding protein [Oenococcus sicerae]MDN6900115.1 phosphonate ABC transporter ATP-binding protein [Oenococcus sicerae]QAS69724.1 phosphonate ABC transporter ATP-binding protein [Oenococcus sicerae]
MTDTNLIEIKNVNKIYDNGVVGLKDINLNVKKGEFIVIVGLSGAGKSTLLRSINRLHDVSSGDILIDGQSIQKATGKKLRRMRRDVAMIFQNFNLVKRASVRRNVLSGRVGYYGSFKSTLGLFKKSDVDLAVKSLQRVNLAEKFYDRADALSGGQQQRVAIARALMQEPKIMLADEPTASLDPATSTLVMDDLKSLNKDLGITVVANLHNEGLALKYGSRIIGLRAGELVFDKAVEQVSETDFDEIYGRTGQIKIKGGNK